MSDPKPNPLADPEVVKGRADWDEYGVEEWAAVAKPPLIYAPPQLTPAKTGFNPCNPSVVQHRDLVCYPLASCFLSCCFHPDVSKWGDNAEATAAKMLDAHAPGSFNKCPKPFRGLFWLENNTASETVTTFEDAIWSDDGLRGMKNSTDNWLRDYTCCGSMIVILSGVVGWSISKDGKWLMWGKADPMYIVQEGDKFINPDGSPYEPAIEVGDLVRCSYWGKNVEQTADKWVYDDALGVYSNANLQFQYVIRRLAYRDEDSGELTKTKHWDRFTKLSLDKYPTAGLRARFCCGGCTSSEARIENLSYLNPKSYLFFASPPPNLGPNSHADVWALMNPDSEAAKAVREEERRKAAHAKVQNLMMTRGKVPPKVMV